MFWRVWGGRFEFFAIDSVSALPVPDLSVFGLAVPEEKRREKRREEKRREEKRREEKRGEKNYKKKKR